MAAGGREGARGRVEVIEPDRPREVAARVVAESKATIPHLYAEAEADVTGWEELLVPGIGAAAAMCWAAARALREVPRLNGAYRDGRFELYGRVNVGIVVPAGEGWSIPVVRDCDEKDLAALAAECRGLAERARSGELASPDLAGATFTVCAAGAGGADAMTPVVQRGHAAALGAGAPRTRAVARDGALVAGEVLRVTLAADHRIVAPGDASSFLARVRALLEERPPPSA